MGIDSGKIDVVRRADGLKQLVDLLLVKDRLVQQMALSTISHCCHGANSCPWLLAVL
jgi:hypothetical protein